MRTSDLRISISTRQISMQIALLLFFAVLCIQIAGQETESAKTLHNTDISAADIASAQQLGQIFGIADWLGPLAPVALSPFFGIACLSGMAIYCQGWVSADNALLGESSPLNNQAIFFAFLVLTLITSLPRLTKVSKPFAQAVDQIEAWAGIITMLALKIMLGTKAPEMAEVAVMQLGFVSFTTNAMLMIAAVINVFVINTVKFFFEILVWITPVPTIDAVFEFTNKTACAVLMAIYGYSPVVATGINLITFVAAGIVFIWSYRREIYFRTMLIDALWALISPARCVGTKELVVFPVSAAGPFSARARCIFRRTDTGWTLTQHRFLQAPLQLELAASDSAMELDAGYFTNTLKMSGRHSTCFTFSRWYNACLPELAKAFGATLNAQDAAVLRNRSGLKSEMG